MKSSALVPQIVILKNHDVTKLFLPRNYLFRGKSLKQIKALVNMAVFKINDNLKYQSVITYHKDIQVNLLRFELYISKCNKLCIVNDYRVYYNHKAYSYDDVICMTNMQKVHNIFIQSIEFKIVLRTLLSLIPNSNGYEYLLLYNPNAYYMYR